DMHVDRAEHCYLLATLCLLSSFFTDPATTAIYTLSLHDALPISGKGGKSFKIGNAEAGVSDRLQIDCLCFFIDLLFETGRMVHIGEPRLHAQPLEGNLELIVGSAVQMGAGHEILTRLQNIVQGKQLCRLARSRSKSRNTAFQSRYPFFEDIGGRVHDPGIDVAKFLQCKKICAVLRAVEYKGSGLVNRYRACIGCRIRFLTGVYLQRFKTII